jgi:ketosteroid isomerase-like protein
MPTAIDVVRAAFAALDMGDMENATAAIAASLAYRLHGEHPLAGEFEGNSAALGALGRLAKAGGEGTTVRLAEAWPAGPELVLAHLVRRAGAGAGPVESDVATIIRVDHGKITEVVSVSSRALDAYWARSGSSLRSPAAQTKRPRGESSASIETRC